jgi:hypothetical protein
MCEEQMAMSIKVFISRRVGKALLEILNWAGLERLVRELTETIDNWY